MTRSTEFRHKLSGGEKSPVVANELVCDDKCPIDPETGTNTLSRTAAAGTAEAVDTDENPATP